jgi:hypothetical protein
MASMPEGNAIVILLIFGVIFIIFSFIMLFDSHKSTDALKGLLIGAGMVAISLLRINQIRNRNK